MWPLPEPGDFVWCPFPERPRDQPGPKPRPALVLAIAEHEDGAMLTVAYGTSQGLAGMRAGEFAIRRVENAAAYALSGLSYDTKFDLRRALDLPWSDAFFAVAPGAPHGQTPKVGTLHPSMMAAARAAASAAKSR